MGWGDVISIGLGLSNLAVNASNASTLEQLKAQQVGEVLYREFISAMRNGMFNLKQTAESVLAGEEESPLKAAGAMRILDHQLSSSGVTPDLFPELSDKEYAAATARLVSSNSKRMYDALDIDGKKQVDQLVEHLKRLADLQYYLEHADNASRLKAAETSTNDGNTFQNKGCLIAIGLFVVSSLLVLVSGELGMLAMFASWVVGIGALVSLVGKRQAGKSTQKKIKELEDSIDLPRFYTLEQQFDTPEEAKQLQKQSEQYVENFFGDYTLLQDGWRS
jgi:hypothetical protein